MAFSTSFLLRSRLPVSAVKLSRSIPSNTLFVIPSLSAVTSNSLPRRQFHTRGPLRAGLPNVPQLNTDVVTENAKKAVVALQKASPDTIYHWTNISLGVATPIALVLSPSFLNIPVDLALGVIVPVHMHFGLMCVIQDYVPRPNQGVAAAILYLLTGISLLGMLKLNLCGSGVTESVKSLWREPKPKKQIKE